MSNVVLRILGVLLAVLLVAFALLAVDTTLALVQGRPSYEALILARLVSNDFAFDARSGFSYMIPRYTEGLARIGPHVVLGAISVGLGLLQFVPALRRRNPRLHRACGFLVWVTGAASLIAVLAWMGSTRLDHGVSSPAFRIASWALTLLTLLLLWQALCAIWSRDFRSHMVWMALFFAGMTTPAALRVFWLPFSPLWAEHGFDTVNLATVTFSFMQMLFVMAVWLTTVGDADQPARQPAAPSAWPRWAVLLVSGLAVGGALQEGLLVPLGLFDPFASVREAADRLPPAAALWALAGVAAMVLAPAAWRRALDGARPSAAVTALTVLVALGALVVGMLHDRSNMARFASATFWLAYGVFVLVALLLAHLAPANSAGRNAWGLTALAALWLPSQLNGLLVVGLMAGLSFAESMTQALVNGIGGIVVVGIATGFAARFRLWPQPRRAVLAQPA